MSRSAFIAAAFVALGSADAAIIIDEFIVPHGVTITAAAPPTQSAFSIQNPTLTVLGVERDLVVTKTSGSLGDQIAARVNPNGQERLRYSTDSLVRGSVQIQWDGIDNSPAIDFTGLGGLNFSMVTAFEIGVAFSNLAGPIIFQVYNFNDPTGNTFATSILNVPPVASSTPFQLPVTGFSLTGPGTVADVFANVGAITMTIDGTAAAQTSWDIDLEYVIAIPEPATWAMLLLGVGILTVRRTAHRRVVGLKSPR